MNVKVKRKHSQVKLPSYATPGSAGLDLYADSFLKLYAGSKEADLTTIQQEKQNKGVITLRPGERLLVGTGLYMEIPMGYELQVRSKSGRTLKEGMVVANSPGTIDSDYRGEVGVILINTTKWLMDIKLGEKIAQGVFAKYEQAEWQEVKELESTSREGGFGSTGLT